MAPLTKGQPAYLDQVGSLCQLLQASALNSTFSHQRSSPTNLHELLLFYVCVFPSFVYFLILCDLLLFYLYICAVPGPRI